MQRLSRVPQQYLRVPVISVFPGTSEYSSHSSFRYSRYLRVLKSFQLLVVQVIASTQSIQLLVLQVLPSTQSSQLFRYSRDSRRVLGHFSFRCSTYSRILSHVSFWFSRYLRVLSHFKVWNSRYSREYSVISSESASGWYSRYL